MNRVKEILLFVFVLAFAGSLFAGVYVESVERDLSETNGGQDILSKIFIEKDRVRMEIPGMKNMIVIYRHDKQVFWMIDMQNKTYSEMTKKDLEGIKSQMDNMKMMMKEQMKNVPADHRDMVEKMMGQNMTGTEAVKTVYEKKKSGVKVGQWTTTLYEGFESGKKVEDVYACELSELGLTMNDLQVLNSMGEFFKAMGTSDEDFLSVKSKESVQKGEYSGIPVKEIRYDNGEKTSETVVKTVEKRDFQSDLFNIPAKFNKTDNPLKQGQMFNQ